MAHFRPQLVTAPAYLDSSRTRRRRGMRGLGAGGAVMVTAPGGATVSSRAGGARAPEEIGADIARHEALRARAETSDSPCDSEWTVLLFDVSCDRALSLVYSDLYAEAQLALAALAAQPDPTDATSRAAFVGLVGAYGWVMTWAAGVMGRCLPLDAANGAQAFHWYVAPTGDPSVPVDSTHHYSRGGYILPATGVGGDPGLGFAWTAGTHSTTANAHRALDISLTQLNQNRCLPGVWSGGRLDGGKPVASIRTIVGVDERWATSEGGNRVQAARLVARQLAAYTVIDLWSDAFTAYAAKLAEWRAEGLPTNVDSATSARVMIQLQQARGQQTADIAVATAGSAAAIAGAIAPVAGILIGIVAAIYKLFAFLPQAAGGVPCPYPFLFRTVTNPECSASTTAEGGAEHVMAAFTPTVEQLVAAQAAARAQQQTKQQALLSTFKTATPTTVSPIVKGAAAVGVLGIIALVVRALRRKR